MSTQTLAPSQPFSQVSRRTVATIAAAVVALAVAVAILLAITGGSSSSAPNVLTGATKGSISPAGVDAVQNPRAILVLTHGSGPRP